MRKIIIMSLTMNLIGSSQSALVNALEVPEPYVVTQSINYESIPLEDCLILLQNPLESVGVDETTVSESTVSEVEENLQLIQAQYNAINDEISILESGESDSLDWANSELMYVIEQVYDQYFETNPDFGYLSEEEQLAIVSNHEVVIEWQNYILEIQAIINQKIADRDMLEQSYSNLNYTYTELQAQQESNAETKADYNQCQIYPYSSEYISPDQILLNDQVLLNDYLVQIDGYLQKIVAKAYRKVGFEDIYQVYQQQFLSNNPDDVVPNKPNIVLDSLAYEKYSYAKELSLIDIETLAQYAYHAYTKNQNVQEYTESYQSVIQLKENQWHYMHQVNPEAIEMIKLELVNYLNTNGLTDEHSIDMVRSVHQRYQVKLVFFDDASQSWVSNDTDSSGYYNEYMDKELKLFEEESESMESSDVIDETLIVSSEDLDDVWDETEDELPKPNNHLESLKDQLGNVRDSSSVKTLNKPSDLNKKDKDKPNSDKNNGKIELPSTGERQPFTLIALVILIIGIILILISIIKKRKRREELDQIDLD